MESILKKKGIIKSFFIYGFLGFFIIFATNFLGAYIFSFRGFDNEIEFLIFSLIFLTLIPLFLLGIIFYFSLKINVDKFNLIHYQLKSDYLAGIFLVIFSLDIILNFILTKGFKFPKIGLLTILLVFIIPLFIKPEKSIDNQF